ncbi:MAG: transposase [Desulfuromonadaceae bacterium]|nr:transposase [Desulfuromonadaceae bacterium]
MTYNPDIHHRHSIRLTDNDYSQVGAYFVTVCVWKREGLFGEIVNGEMVLNDMGQIVVEELERTSEMRSNVELDVYSIMPNHFHAIILIINNVGATPMARPGAIGNNVVVTHKNRATQRVAPTGPVSGSIGAVMAQFKSIVTKRINALRNNHGCPVWQRNYYERVIRNEDELSRAREYIVNNPLKWELDKENPVNVPG